MTSAFLQSELASLIQDSKRRSSEVRTAAEKSLADLKAIHVTSESQLAGDLLRRPQFIDPFILACNTKHAKLAVTGAICLQRLVASQAIPPGRLGDVLDAFQEAAHQGLEIQLKVLQALPSLLQLYARDLQGDLLAKILSLCACLAGSRTALVNSTAAATFQQLITTVFEKQAQTQDSTETGASNDAQRIFEDVCLVLKGEQPRFLKPQGLSLLLAIEVIETSLSNQELAILATPSCLTACKEYLIPGIVEILEKTTSFPSFGKTMRVLYILATQYLQLLHNSLSSPFSTTLNIIDRPSGPHWRRVLCLEFMRTITSDHQLTRSIFALFDRQENQKSVIGNLMSILVRIAAEDPALIGLGRQSTIPTSHGSENPTNVSGGATVDVDAVGSVLQASSNVTGISSKWSVLGSPMLEQLEKSTPPDVPETYIYTLVLGCVASFTDGLSKFIMPLSVPSRVSSDFAELEDADGEPGVPARKNSQVRRAAKYQRLLNPLVKDDLASKEEVQVCANMIENCWPAVLATCSTFLNSALDSYFYHVLIRTVQKLAQVSGVLELLTPRDALLTTLAKVSVPINAPSIVTVLHGSRTAKISKDDDEDADEMSIKSPVLSTPRHSVDVSRQPLNVRNLLCLRALLNLGIALGPTLSESSWFIIIQALQQVEALMSVNPSARAAATKNQSQEEADAEGQTSLGSEITAVSTASKRMLESTKTFTDDTFRTFVLSVFKVIESLVSSSDHAGNGGLKQVKQELTVIPRRHKATRSVSGVLTSSTILHIEAEFVLKTVSDIARVNLHRFTSDTARSCSWDLIVSKLLVIVSDYDVNTHLRLQAASVVDVISVETMKALEKQSQEPKELNALQETCLNALAKQVRILYKPTSTQPVVATDIEVHRRLLEALENIVSHSGDSLTQGWQVVFRILQETTGETSGHSNDGAGEEEQTDREAISSRTIPPAFRTVQLIVSDFLNTIDPASFSILVQLLPLFGIQNHDLNISLTTTALFWNVSSVLLERTDSIDVRSNETGSPQTRSQLVSADSVDVSSLWIATVRQLCRLCEDSRSEVRNSALRVLLRVFDSASQQLSPRTWNLSLQRAFMPLLRACSDNIQDPLEQHASFAQLLEGLVRLFVQNAKAISGDPEFPATWTALIETLDTKLEKKDLAGHAVVFTSVAELLRALYESDVRGGDYASQLLRSWANSHPADLEHNEQPNQAAFRAHAELLTAIYATADDDLGKFSSSDRSLVDITMNSIKQTALSSIHPPYSSDITKLASEQEALVANIGILQKLLKADMQKFTLFLLDLISSILERNTMTEVEKQRIVTGSKNFKRPTLIALMSQCIDFVRHIIKKEANHPSFLTNVAAVDALLILNKVVRTKYTPIPTNNDAPGWQNATSAIVELSEAIAGHVQQIDVKEVDALSQPVAHALESIITAPALEIKEPPPSAETITADETFDIEHFTRFHKASIPLLQLESFSQTHRRQYILILFHASLVAKPWFGDLPPAVFLLSNPLCTIKDLRPGTVRPPDFYLRINIPYTTFSALLSLSDQTTHPSLATARAAAPYLLLRLSHTLKTFLSDQRLRNLNPPPRQLQHELNTVLTHAMDLRVLDAAFAHLVTSGALVEDGKAHLRILYPLVLRMREFWTRLPRLKVCAWQEDREGKEAEEALRRWSEVVGEGWEVRVDV